MSNNLFVSTACLEPIESITSRISKYTHLGINSIELGMKVFVDSDWINEINKPGLSFTIHNYFPPPEQQFVLNLSSPDEEIRQKSVAHAIKSIELAKTLNAKIYSVHAGFVNDPESSDADGFIFPLRPSEIEYQDALQRYFLSVSTILPFAEKHGVQLLIENNICANRNIGKLLFCDTRDYKMLFSKFHSPNLGCLIDTEHISVSAQVLNFSRDEMITSLADKKFAFHLSLDKPISPQEDENKNSSWDVEVVKQNKQAVVILETTFSTIHELAMTYNSLTQILNA